MKENHWAKLDGDVSPRRKKICLDSDERAYVEVVSMSMFCLVYTLYPYFCSPLPLVKCSWVIVKFSTQFVDTAQCSLIRSVLRPSGDIRQDFL